MLYTSAFKTEPQYCENINGKQKKKHKNDNFTLFFHRMEEKMFVKRS